MCTGDIQEGSWDVLEDPPDKCGGLCAQETSREDPGMS